MSEKKIFKEFVVKGEKISKWVTKNEETEYDSNGNKIYYKDSAGKENYYENQYNSDGKLIKITKYSPM